MLLLVASSFKHIIIILKKKCKLCFLFSFTIVSHLVSGTTDILFIKELLKNTHPMHKDRALLERTLSSFTSTANIANAGAGMNTEDKAREGRLAKIAETFEPKQKGFETVKERDFVWYDLRGFFKKIGANKH